MGFDGGMDVPLTELPPLRLYLPEIPAVPLVFASPHSGRAYPPGFVAESRLDALRLRRSEDGFVDELFAAAPDHGAALLCATFPRAWCDANREAWELDPEMFEDQLPGWVNADSLRVGAGLGTIARVVASGETIYRRKLRFTEAEARVAQCWQPYHAALEGLLASTQARFGAVLLVDCHSMPGPVQGQPDMVLGDIHGRTCNPAITALLERLLRDQGYRVRRNDPYAGGYTTRHYGHPESGRHAIQIEVARGLYMDEARMRKLPGFTILQRRLQAVIAELAATGTGLFT